MRLSKAAAVCGVLLAGASLTACGGGQAPNYDPHTTYKISAEQKEAVLVLDAVDEAKLQHDRTVATRLGAFATDFANRASSNVQILVGARAEDDAAARTVAHQVARALSQRGVPSSRMDLKLVVSRGIRSGTVVLRYAQWVAVAPECPGFNSNMMIDYSNTPSQNFGCSIQRNVAAMVADPRDLVQPQATAPRLGMPGEAVIRKFRQGEDTNTFEWETVDLGGE